jgi:penicillin amidase
VDRPLGAEAYARVDAIPDPDFVLGSNNWAVSGAHTKSGAPLLADDMHLQITVPNIWYRASLVWKDPEDAEVTGDVGHAGSWQQRNVAWGFTNSEGDWPTRGA